VAVAAAQIAAADHVSALFMSLVLAGEDAAAVIVATPVLFLKPDPAKW
jgi:hypothetical protein